MGVTHSIPLESLTPKKPVKAKIEDGAFHMPAEESKLGKSRHHVNIPGKYKLPFRIDMTAKLKFIRTNQTASQLNLYIGKGKVYFNGGHTSATDILTDAKGSTVGDAKFTSFVYYNGIPDNDYVDISIIFGSEMLWVTVDGQFCFASDKLPYIELLRENAVPEEFADGIGMAICGGTDTRLSIKSLTLTEYGNDEQPDIPFELSNLPNLSQFELYVQGLPPKAHDEMYKMDEYLLRNIDMKRSLKFRRSIDKHGHLTYNSPVGILFGLIFKIQNTPILWGF